MNENIIKDFKKSPNSHSTEWGLPMYMYTETQQPAWNAMSLNKNSCLK